MPPITPKQVKDIVGGAFDILDEASDLTSGRDPNYIRDAEPDNVFDAIALEAARQGCRRYAEKGDAYPSGRAARAERACRPYLDDIGKPPGPTIGLPFRGGQCAGINYRVRGFSEEFAFSDCSTLGPAPFDVGLVGPILGTETRTVNPSGPLCTPGGNEFFVISGNPPVATRIAGAGYGVNVTGFNVVREDGLPDSCGNPPPVVTGPEPDPNPDPPGPQPYERPPDIDIDIDVEIGPTGDIIIDIGTGPITIDPFADPPPDGGDNGEDEPDGPSDGPPGDPGDPGEPEDVEGGDETSGCAPAGSVLVGVRVQITGIPSNPNRYTDEVYRGAYYAYMGMPGLLDHDPAGAMAIEDQFLFAEKDNLTCYRVRANKGYSLRVTPYYREVE